MNSFNLAEDSLKSFLKTLQTVLLADNKHFDLILGAGDSGQVMTYITRLAFAHLNLPIPPSIVFPIYRYKNFPKKILFDNSPILKDYAHIYLPKTITHVLFVDDEIENGTAAQATLQLFNTLRTIPDPFHCTIIAEDGGFDPKKILNNYNIKYLSPKTRTDGIYNTISLLIPKEYKDSIQQNLQSEHLSWNNMQLMCILLNLPIKELEYGKPTFNFRLHLLVKKFLPNLEELQEAYQKYITQKIL